jgi:hypothetical protein
MVRHSFVSGLAENEHVGRYHLLIAAVLEFRFPKPRSWKTQFQFFSPLDASVESDYVPHDEFSHLASLRLMNPFGVTPSRNGSMKASSRSG